MRAWTRHTALDQTVGAEQREVWEYRDGARAIASCEVDVRVGKPLDVLALKGSALEETRAYARFLHQTASHLYARERVSRELAACPCCDAAVAPGHASVTVFGVAYLRCGECGHVFVGIQPAVEALAEIFSASEAHSATYTDQASLEARLSQVVRPKLAWMCEVYQRWRGREAQSVLDVGAGGGHFVAACRREGLRAEGYEISEPSRRFAQEAFGVALRPEDFLEALHPPGQVDVLTFWGLLEYTPEPRRFLDTARRMMDGHDGLLVVEVPRFESVSSAIQALCPERVARHLDPTSHVNCFSDASLATLLHRTGFRPVAAWYFGMDAYELLVQLALELDLPDGLARLARMLPGLQSVLDAAHLCDDIIVAAVPEQ